MRILILHEDPRDPEQGQGGGGEVLRNELRDVLTERGHTVRCLTSAMRSDLDSIDFAIVGTVHNTGANYIVEPLQRERIPHLWLINHYWPFCPLDNALYPGDRTCAANGAVCDHACQRYAPDDWVRLINGSYHVTYNEYAAAIMRRNGLRVDAVVPLGVDTERFTPSPGRSAQPLICTSAAWAAHPAKGMHILREAIRGTELKVGLITGMPRSDVVRALQACDIYVFPSVYEETWGLCLTEAMACGCAVVASDVGAAKTQIQDCHSGLLYPRYDAAELRILLRWLLAHPEEIREYGYQARQAVLRNGYTRQGMGDRFEAAIAAACEAIRKPS